MKQKIINTLKIMSAFFQSSTDSFQRHNGQYEAPGKFERDRDAGYDNLKKDLLNAPPLRIRNLLALHPQIKTAVDVGSGTGWGAAAISPLVDTVLAFEPSAAALDISKRAYPTGIYPNITWIQGFAEEVLPTLHLPTPTIFFTGCVLSHLRDKEALLICRLIDETAPAGSVISFAEAWGERTWHQIMWHIRTKGWWEKALPNWTLDFHGDFEPGQDFHMGFWGTKK